MRRWLIGKIGLAAAALLLSACGGGDSSPPREAIGVPTPAAGSLPDEPSSASSETAPVPGSTPDAAGGEPATVAVEGGTRREQVLMIEVITMVVDDVEAFARTGLPSFFARAFEGSQPERLGPEIAGIHLRVDPNGAGRGCEFAAGTDYARETGVNVALLAPSVPSPDPGSINP